MAVDHAAALALHDLERNLRVVDHARRAVAAYRTAGRIEAQLIMGVNLGDGLWGAGRVTACIGDAEVAERSIAEAERLVGEESAPLPPPDDGVTYLLVRRWGARCRVALKPAPPASSGELWALGAQKSPRTDGASAQALGLSRRLARDRRAYTDAKR